MLRCCTHTHKITDKITHKVTHKITVKHVQQAKLRWTACVCAPPFPTPTHISRHRPALRIVIAWSKVEQTQRGKWRKQ